MSLINDALKRVSSQSASAASAQSIPGGALEAVPAEHSPSGTGKTLLVIGGLLVGILAGGTYLMRADKVVAKSVAAPVAAKPQAVAAQPEAAAQSVGTSIAERLTKPLEAARAVAVVSEAQTAEAEKIVAQIQAPSAPAPVVAESKPLPVQPKRTAAAPRTASQNLRLQAIYYRLENPTAVINGKTVREGDLLAGAKVATINRNSVELDVAGSRKTVRLE